MENMIFNPLEDYEKKLNDLHAANTEKFFNALVEQSKINIEDNRNTVKQYETYQESLKKLRRKLNLFRFFRVLMIITVILIPLVILKMTPKIKGLRSEIELADQKAAELLALAESQMLPLNQLFTSRDALKIIETTIPQLSFDQSFTVEREADMQTNYDFFEQGETERSTIDMLSGEYNENPFLFQNELVHSMGEETYHGYKTISWTETYIDSDGNTHTRRESQTLHATVVKPKPFYNTHVVLNYGSQGAPDLYFSRDASHLEEKSEREIERIVKKGEKRLKQKTDKAIEQNRDFMSMSNSDFEVLFDALDRTDEVQFRTLFTPLAQTNMVSLLLSKVGYGDDFNFYKQKRMNTVASQHSQGRPIILLPSRYISYSFDVIKESFFTENTNYFKAVYFDFAPILAIPIYQERPVHSLKPLPDLSRLYSQKESEVLANAVDKKYLVHPQTKTQAIIKPYYIKTSDNADETCVTAYSYDIVPRVEIVSVWGNDGKFHNVSVPWDEYVPLEAKNSFYVTKYDDASVEGALASKNGLCILQSKS